MTSCNRLSALNAGIRARSSRASSLPIAPNVDLHQLELIRFMMEAFFGPIDFLFYGLALYAGFRFAVSGFQRRRG